LIDGLKDGTIDCIATDHAPHARSEKEVPFEQAPMGSTGLETAFASIYTELVLPGSLDLALLVRRMSDGAGLFEMPTPQIAAGAAANVTLIDLDAKWIVGEHGYVSRSDNCCFDGMALRGQILLTVAAGAVVHRANMRQGVAA
jgi:dihydroorotase